MSHRKNPIPTPVRTNDGRIRFFALESDATDAIGSRRPKSSTSAAKAAWLSAWHAGAGSRAAIRCCPSPPGDSQQAAAHGTAPTLSSAMI